MSRPRTDKGKGSSTQDGEGNSLFGNDHDHCRSDQRNPKFLHRFLRHSFYSCNAADGHEGDVARFDPIAACHQSVPKFMQHHATKQGDDEGATRQRGPFIAVITGIRS